MNKLSTAYPLLIPPEPLATRDRRDWSHREAKAYKTWLLDNVDGCVNYLLTFLGFDVTDLEEEKLGIIGKRWAEVASNSEFSKRMEQRIELTNQGYALTADMGLLVAKLLLDKHHPEVQWSIVRRPKSDISYNLPVLTGFGPLTLDPILGALAEGRDVLLGRKDVQVWLTMYKFWEGKVSA